MTQEIRSGEQWPPQEGQRISFQSGEEWKTGILREVRWGLVWRDFVLDDGRVIPEIKVKGCPKPQTWRAPAEVTRAEREGWEERLATMASAGLDPHEREQSFRAELNQYLAYVYLKFKRAVQPSPDVEHKADDFPERIQEVKEVVTGRLTELLEVRSGPEECESAAYSLGRLKDLETSLRGGEPRRSSAR
jgi:hypothetical protein